MTPFARSRGGGGVGGGGGDMGWTEGNIHMSSYLECMHGRILTELAMAGRILGQGDSKLFHLMYTLTDVYLAPMVAQWVGPTRAKKYVIAKHNKSSSSDKAKTYCM